VSRAILKDLAVALFAAVVVAEGPLTPAATVPSIIAGVIAGGFLFYWRRTRPQTPTRPGIWYMPWHIAVALLVYIAAAFPTLAWMYREWTGSVWHNSHGILIPLLMFLLGRNILRRMPPRPDEPTAWGFAVLVPGLILLILDAGAATHYIGAAGIVVTLPGLSLLLLGPARTRALSLPLVLGIFMIPLPNALASQVYLRTMTADGVAPILVFLGIPTLVDNSLLELSQASFLVANTCSGFSTLYATIAMAVLLASLCESRTRRIIAYASILPLALAANIIRVVVLVLIYLYINPDLLDTSLHAASGVATFFVVLGVLILLTDRPSLARAML
jgi:exosortase